MILITFKTIGQHYLDYKISGIATFITKSVQIIGNKFSIFDKNVNNDIHYTVISLNVHMPSKGVCILK